MAAIDLCQVSDVRYWLNISPQQDSLVNTTSAASIAAGLAQVVSPVTMTGININGLLAVGTGSPEVVVVTSADPVGGSFTADFSLAHIGPVPIVDVTDQILGRLVTACSVTLVRKMNRMAKDGSIPTQSVLSSVQTFNDWYDGNGGQRLFLRNGPIQTLTALTINGITIPQSTGPTAPGWVVDDTGDSIALRNTLVGIPLGWQHRGIFSRNLTVWGFARGIQNVNVQYTAGFATTPQDIQDACIELVALCYKRRNWIDQSTDAKANDIGQVKYRDWEYPPRVQDVIAHYRRRWGA